jgi:competence protein ComEC
MERFRKYAPLILLILLILFAWGIWYYIYSQNFKERYLKVAFLDIGQGDAIYIEAPNGTQMLIDGGPSTALLSKLSKVMPFGDRSIDIVLATHTDADHIGGLPSVVSLYSVGSFIDNGATSETKIYKALQTMIKEKNVPRVVAHKGMHIVLDQEKNIYFDILFPDRDISKFESNDGSIVGKLVYGNESFMLTGDATNYTENLIMQTNRTESLHATVLKLGHHGSHTSSSQLWLENVDPDLAVISAGLHNRYGHPHQDIIDRLSNMNIPYLATYIQGTIMFKTDGIQLSY